MSKLLAIVGPTGAGKTSLAIRLAEELGAEIVSCDSMQLFREFDIGTAKPSADEQRRVPHHLIDVADPSDSFSAAEYAQLADRAIADILARGRRVLVVGGTGLYLRALRFGLFDAPPRDDALRQRLLDLEHVRPGALHLQLRAVDPDSATRIAPADLVRIIRAIEVFELTGQPLSHHHANHVRAERYPMRVAVLDPPDGELGPRLQARAEVMLASGLVDETRGILQRHGPTLRPLSAVGYQQVTDYLRGELSAEKLAPAIYTATRRYVKRQRTWFRKEANAVHYPDADTLYSSWLTEER